MTQDSHLAQKIAGYASAIAEHGHIKGHEFLFDRDICTPLSLPDNPFHYQDLFDKDPETLPDPGDRLGTEVAVIGAGAAGLAAANLLMRAGLRPVVYELSERIGGRAFTRPFEEDPKAFAEIGAMRIPLAQELVFFLCRRWKIKWHRFPNPLVVDTVIDVYNEQVFYDSDSGKYFPEDLELTNNIKEVQRLYKSMISPFVSTWKAADFDERLKLWRSYVQLYNNKSFFQMLVESGWTPEQIELFGFIGIGSGGFDSFYTSSFLEILRVEIQQLETDQQLIVGGTEQIPVNLWSEKVPARHWGVTSVEELNGGKPRPGVRRIRAERGGRTVRIEDLSGETRDYRAAILTPTPRAIDMTMDINHEAFSQAVWNSLRDLELVASEKVFILTKSAFWKNPNSSKQEKFFTTLSDQPPRQMYLFEARDFGIPTEAGVMCLSYAWAASSIKFDSLTNDQRVEICLEAIEKMKFYGPEMRRKIEDEMIGSFSLTWEGEYGYNGGWRMANPGQAESVHILHEQGLGRPEEDVSGIYLAGEALSWYGLSGWIDGALKTGLHAAVSAIARIGSESGS